MRLLITVWPAPGHFYPNLAIAAGLRRRGHQVGFYTGAQACPVIEKEGFQCFEFDKLDERIFNRVVMAPDGITGQRKHPLKLRRLLYHWLVGTIPGQLADLDRVMQEFAPDVLLCDPAMWGPILILHETKDIPVAVFSYVAGCMLPGPDAPPYGLGLRRARNPRQRWMTELVRIALQLFLAKGKRGANELRRAYGLPPLRVSMTQFAGQMPLYLMPSIPELDYQRTDLPPSVHYVGPCLWDRSDGEGPPGWLRELPRDRPLVYVSEGTVHSTKPVVLSAAAQGLAGDDLQVVITTGRQRDSRGLSIGPIAPNIRVERYVPMSDLLAFTDAVVTTGGSGTVLAALTRGVPLVVIPTDWDQPENAQRVQESGAGIRLAARGLTPDRLRRAVARILEDPSFRRNATRLASAFAKCDGPVQAARLLEGLHRRETLASAG